MGNLRHIYSSIFPSVRRSLLRRSHHTTLTTMSSSDPSYKKKESIEQRQDAEQTVNRNPHGDFSKVQASRPDFNHAEDGFRYTKTPAPEWQLGDGGNDRGASVSKKQIQIDPYEDGRPAVFNYKLMISAIVPRPIGFVSTRSKDGMSEMCCRVERRCAD
jgi:hypothetical protein